MNRQILNAARNVQTPLLAAENALDQVIAESARITLAMIDARTSNGLPLMVGQAAFERNAAVFSTLAGVRREMSALHADLRAAGGDMGIRAYGDQFECPDEERRSRGAEGPLRVVA